MKEIENHLRDPRNPRSLLYAYKDPDEKHCYWFHGICFAEFHAVMRLRSALVILSNDYLEGFDEDPVSRFMYVEPGGIAQLAEQNIFEKCGDFAWADCASIAAIRKVSPRNIAAFLYLGRMYKALGNPFKAGLNNRFVYLEHDDGWVLKLYVRYAADAERLLEGVAGMKCRHFLKVPLKYPGLGRRLMRLAREGVLLDFRGPTREEIRVCVAGGTMDMDDLLKRVSDNRMKLVAKLVGRGRQALLHG